MNVNEVKIAGRTFEDATALTKRIGISDTGIRILQNEGLPKPIRIGRKRFWDKFQVDQWLLKRVK
jgi:predicted DNA-binding transcriptional regulator AlpA